MKRYFVVIGSRIYLSGCEKDDICDANTITTPD
jgi:hypothetical protein